MLLYFCSFPFRNNNIMISKQDFDICFCFTISIHLFICLFTPRYIKIGAPGDCIFYVYVKICKC